MSPAGWSVLLYGFYLGIVGSVALVCPGAWFSLFGLALPSEDVWVRVAGWLTTAVGLYYVAAAWRSMNAFYFVTVLVRVAAVLVLVLLVWWADAPAQLLVFAVLDALGALVTQLLLLHEAKSAAARAPEIASNPG